MDFTKDGHKNTYMGRKTLVLFYHWLIQEGRVKPKGAAYRRMIDIQRGDKVQAQWLTIRRDIENEI